MVGRVVWATLAAASLAVLVGCGSTESDRSSASTGTVPSETTASPGATGDNRPPTRPSPWPKVTRLADGATVSVGRNGRVVVRDPRGELTSLSHCWSYANYRRFVTLMSSFRTAVLTGDRDRVAASFRYPLRWNHHPGRTVLESREELLENYEAIFHPRVVRVIREADPRDIGCRDIGAMIGNGVVWADYGSSDERPAIYVIFAHD